MILAQDWSGLNAFLAADLPEPTTRARSALVDSPDLGVAGAFADFYARNDSKACVEFLATAKLADKSMVTS